MDANVREVTTGGGRRLKNVARGRKVEEGMDEQDWGGRW
jgi:hypothetical protein